MFVSKILTKKVQKINLKPFLKDCNVVYVYIYEGVSKNKHFYK